MALAEGQVQLRGLVMGPGTPYRFDKGNHFNPFARTVRTTQSGQRPWRDGSWSGREVTAAAAIPMRIVTLGAGAAGMLALHRPLAAAFEPSDDDLELRFVIGGQEMVMFGRPRVVAPEPRHVDGTTYYSLGFEALDPTMYGATEHVETLGLPSTSGGLTFPATFPAAFDATVTSGRKAIANAGLKTTGLLLRIDGPAPQPRVSILAGGVVTRLRVLLDLAAGEFLDIDTRAQTALLQGQVSRRNQVPGDWPLLPPGTHEIAFDADLFDPAALLTVRWRDAWH